MVGMSAKLPKGIVLGDRYRIVEQIGQGGFGRTYLAEDTHRYDEKCVLKEFAPLVENDQDLYKAEELFEREAGILYKLKHEQIPQFKALLRTKIDGKKLLFLIQEYIAGKTYYELAKRRGKFTESEAIDLIVELSPVLRYIHEQDLIHRDISPDNLIFRQTDGKPVLIDFGCVKLAANAVSRSQGNLITLIGKKGYAPEEQIRNGKAFPNSDFYALAATVVVLLTGKQPDVLYDTHRGIWQWEKEVKVSPHFAKVLHKMLAYKPRDRYQNASEVLAALKETKTSFVNSFISRIQTLLIAPKNSNSIKNTNTVDSWERDLTSKFDKFNSQTIRTIISNISRCRTKAIAVSQTVPRPVKKIPYARHIKLWQWILIFMATAILPGIVTFSTIHNIRGSIAKVARRAERARLEMAEKTKVSTLNSDRERHRQQEISRRAKALNVDSGMFFGQVDREFYRRYPEMKNISLTNTTRHSQYRRTWYRIAEDLLQKQEDKQ